MTPSAALAYSVVAFLGGGAFTEVATEGTWKDFVAGGAAAAVIFVVILFLKHISSVEAKHAEVTKAQAEAHHKSSEAFASTVNEMAKQAREAHESAIKTLIETLKTR